MANVYLYVDGFNLYYGALKRTPYRWLDLAALGRAMLPHDNILALSNGRISRSGFARLTWQRLSSPTR